MGRISFHAASIMRISTHSASFQVPSYLALPTLLEYSTPCVVSGQSIARGFMQNMAKWFGRGQMSCPSLAKMLGRTFTCIVKVTSKWLKPVEAICRVADSAFLSPLTKTTPAKGDYCRMLSQSERQVWQSKTQIQN
jgi:hypothetical protein